MARIEEHIEIAAPASTVFRTCRDADKRPQWDERVMRIELLSDKPIRQGTLIQVDEGRSGTFLYSWEGEYSSFQFPNNYTIKVLDAAPSSPFKSGSETWRFSTVGSGTTRLSFIWEYTPRNWIGRIVDRLMKRGATRRAIRHSLANLKELVENA